MGVGGSSPLNPTIDKDSLGVVKVNQGFFLLFLSVSEKKRLVVRTPKASFSAVFFCGTLFRLDFLYK